MDIQRKKKRKITKQKFKNESYKNRVLYYKTGRRRVKKKTQARAREREREREGGRKSLHEMEKVVGLV